MKPVKKVEVVHKLTESQIKEARVDDLVERIAKQDIEILELRNMMIGIRKEFAKLVFDSSRNTTENHNSVDDKVPQH